jgi:hypothetical protein
VAILLEMRSLVDSLDYRHHPERRIGPDVSDAEGVEDGRKPVEGGLWERRRRNR